MEIVKVEAQEYASLFRNHSHVFNSVTFTELNKHKCDMVHYFVFRDGKTRLGLIAGEREGVLCSPFSAPFGGFDASVSERLEYYDQAAVALRDYVQNKNTKIRIALPPAVYGSEVAKSFSALMRVGARIECSELNYSYELSRFDDYEDYLERSARKNFHQAMTHDFQFLHLDSGLPGDIERAYTVIRTNRESKGFPLRMSLDDVLQTAPVVSADFFVMSYEGKDVAAAMVYPVTEDICQVIYWGDDPEYSGLKVMNSFTYKVFEYYYSRNKKILDIGPSTEGGIPNYGLCSFKENIGCNVSLKHILELK